MTTKEKPENFNPCMTVGGVIFRVGDEILLFKRGAHKKVGASQWALCAGKIEEGESDEDGVIRECFEETGVQLLRNDIKKVGTYYHSPVTDDTFQIIWITYEVKLDSKPEIVIDEEHDEYKWVHVDDMLTYDLIDGEAYCLDDYIKNF